MKLHDANKNAEALAKYKQAYEIFPTANILFGIARMEQLLGKTVDSVAHYREALKDRALHLRNQELGRVYVADLEKELALIDVKAPAGTTFTLAGKRYVTPLPEPLALEAGPIAIEGSFVTQSSPAR